MNEHVAPRLCVSCRRHVRAFGQARHGDVDRTISHHVGVRIWPSGGKYWAFGHLCLSHPDLQFTRSSLRLPQLVFSDTAHRVNCKLEEFRQANETSKKHLSASCRVSSVVLKGDVCDCVAALPTFGQENGARVLNIFVKRGLIPLHLSARTSYGRRPASPEGWSLRTQVGPGYAFSIAVPTDETRRSRGSDDGASIGV